MHYLNCNCPKCQMSGEQEWEFPYAEELYGEIGWESPFSEVEEMELAAELLSLSSEEEMDQFLGKLFKRAWKGIKKVGRFAGKIAKPLGGVLKKVAKVALPVVGGALGSFIPIPGVGTALGSALGGALSKALEIEFGELEQEDQEYEVARRFVRIAGAAARQAALANTDADWQMVVKNAFMSAARRHVPNFPDGVISASQMNNIVKGYESAEAWPPHVKYEFIFEVENSDQLVRDLEHKANFTRENEFQKQRKLATDDFAENETNQLLESMINQFNEIEFETKPSPPTIPTVEPRFMLSDYPITDAERVFASKAWKKAVRYVYLALWFIEYMKSRNRDTRIRLWNGTNSFHGNHGSGIPRLWFGAYDDVRFDNVRDAVNKIWEKFRQSQWKMKRHDCIVWASAHVIVVPQIRLCDNFFGNMSERMLSEATLILVHEMSHHIWIKSPKRQLKDRHVAPIPPCGGPCYGEENAKMLARDYPKHAVANPDNYAYFITSYGSLV